MRMIDGTPVVDADEPVTVHVTSDDCSRGSKKDPEACAFAVALKRITQCDASRVHLGCTYLRFGNKWLRYATPPSLKAEIISFDRGGGFYPGDFRLRPMPVALRLKPAIPNQKRRRAVFRATSNAAQRTRTEKKVKTSPRPFHRVEGVRARANGVRSKA
jgi:hypothetical protein